MSGRNHLQSLMKLKKQLCLSVLSLAYGEVPTFRWDEQRSELLTERAHTASLDTTVSPSRAGYTVCRLVTIAKLRPEHLLAATCNKTENYFG
jgi:hypothetical protein